MTAQKTLTAAPQDAAYRRLFERFEALGIDAKALGLLQDEKAS